MASEFQGVVHDEVRADLGLNDANEQVVRLDLSYTRCGPRPFKTRVILSVDAAIAIRNQLDEQLAAGRIEIVDCDELVDRADRCPNCGNRRIEFLTPIDSAVPGEAECGRCGQVYRIENAVRRGRDGHRELLQAAQATLRLWNKYGLGDDDAESEPVHQALVSAIANAKRPV
jgi:hypothetical protein